MPRRPSPWYKASHRAWYVKVRGKPHRLGETKDEAWKEFHRLMSGGDEPPAPTSRDRPLLVDMIDAWGDAKKKDPLKPSTLRAIMQFAQNFIDFIPKTLRAADARASLVVEWLDSNPSWNVTSRATAAAKIRQAFAWGLREGWIDRNPVAGLKLPSQLSRPPADRGDVSQVLASVHRGAKEALEFMVATGARPGETVGVQASAIDFKARTVAVSGKTGARVVVVPAGYLAALREIAERRPKGPIFRNKHGTAWTPDTLATCMRRARQRCGAGGPVVPYHMRGIFATDRIAAGVDAAIVAKMLGHSSLDVLHKHYHNPELDTLREAADKPPRKKKPRPKGRGEGQ